MDQATSINRILCWAAWHQGEMTWKNLMRSRDWTRIARGRQEAAYNLRKDCGFAWRHIAEIVSFSQGGSARHAAQIHAEKNHLPKIDPKQRI